MRLPPIERVPGDDETPVSLCQELLLKFLEEVVGYDDSSYNLYRILELGGPLKITVLERTLNEIVRRHEVLRTNFHTVDGKRLQSIAAERTVALPLTDLRHLPESEREAHAYELVGHELARTFDLSRDMLLRASLYQLEEDKYILTLTLHHMVSDGWSMNLFMQEFIDLYRAFSKGALSPLPELPIQYADFARWQRRWAKAEARQDILSYIERHLSGMSQIAFRPDHPQGATPSLRGGHHRFTLSDNLSKTIRAFSRREGVTLYMTMLAALKIILFKQTGHADISILTPAANRTRTETEASIGYFINYLLLRTVLSGDRTFREFLRQVRDVTLEAYDYQELPLEILMQELKLDWVQVLVQYNRYTPASALEIAQTANDAPTHGKLSLKFISIEPYKTTTQGISRRALSLYIVEGTDEIIGTIEYSLDLFRPETISQMVSDYLGLLERVIATPEALLSTLCGEHMDCAPAHP